MPGVAKLITLEGLDGAGKSTLAAGLQAEFPRLTLLREPGGVALSERIRSLASEPGLAVDPRAEALLFAAARAQLVAERLGPLLRSGHDVLLDRFTDSSLAYQGAGRAVGVEAVRQLNAFATGGLAPDRTLLLRVAPVTGAARQATREQPRDRLEREGPAFWLDVAAAYDTLAAAEPDRWTVLDAEQPAPDVLAAAAAVVAAVLGAS